MKFTILFLFISSFYTSFAQCPFALNLIKQSEVDSLIINYPDCVEFNKLVVRPGIGLPNEEIKNINGLGHIISVDT